MYKEIQVSSDVPESKLKRAFKHGTLTLTKDELKGSGATLHLHPESYAKALKARKAGKGTRLAITHKEIGYPFKHMQGGGMYGASIWGKTWGGIKKAFKWAKDSGVLTKIADAAVPALATAVGAPRFAGVARSGLKTLTGVGLDAEKEGGKITMAEVKKRGKQAVAYMKRKGVLTDAADEAKILLSKATKPEHEDVIKTVRGEVRRRYGVGFAIKGSEEAKKRMALVRAARGKVKGGSFRL